MFMLSSLRKIVHAVNQAPGFQEALDELITNVRAAMNTEVCSIYLYDKINDSYVLKATEGLNKKAVGMSIKSNKGLVSLIGSKEEALNLENARSHPNFYHLQNSGEEAFSSFLGVPIIHRKSMLGVLVIQHKKKRRFSSNEEAFLVTISAQLASVIAHAKSLGQLEQKSSLEPPSKNTVFTGVSGSPGVGIGTSVLIYSQADLDAVPERHINAEEKTKEHKLFQTALSKVRNEVISLKQRVTNLLPPEELALFDAYLQILGANSLAKEVTDGIEAGHWAQGALRKVIKKHVSTFEGMDDPYMSERAVDVRDLGLRVLAYLQKLEPKRTAYPDHTILVGEEISTSQIIEVPDGKLKGIVCVKGSYNSHMAIVARALGIATVVGSTDFPLNQIDNQELIVDGFSGQVFCFPSKKLKNYFEQVIVEESQIEADLERYHDQLASTADGKTIDLWINAGLMADLPRLVGRGAEGVGLYRTEIPFMIRPRFPSEQEQIQLYRQQLLISNPLPFTMRTLDIGGDKSLPYFTIEEENPFLGWRGIRITLDHPEIFLTQLRAMLIASKGLKNLRILLPMVSDISELEDAKKLLRRSYDEVISEGFDVQYPPLGVMIEVPSAVLQAKELAKRSDFLSVGSNDLTQYLLAVDRNNPRVANLYHSFHPALIRALKYVANAAISNNTPLGICGEMAGDPRAAVLLFAMDYDSLSMSAKKLSRVKYALKHFSAKESKSILNVVLAMDNTKSIEKYLNHKFKEKGLKRLIHHRK